MKLNKTTNCKASSSCVNKVCFQTRYVIYIDTHDTIFHTVPQQWIWNLGQALNIPTLYSFRQQIYIFSVLEFIWHGSLALLAATHISWTGMKIFPREGVVSNQMYKLKYCIIEKCVVTQHDSMYNHGLSWQVLFVSWALLSTYRMICGTIHAAYINYGQCHVCRCRVQRLHPAMGRHGIVLMLASRALLSTCSIIHVAYIERVNTVPADVWCRLHSSHGQTRHSTCTCKLSFTIYMA